MRHLKKCLLITACAGILLLPVTAISAPPMPKETPTPTAAGIGSSDQPPFVLAQGNAGGTIGKRSRTVSGAEPEAKPAVRTRSLGTTKRSYRRSTPRGTRTAVRSRGNCISGSIAGYHGRVCY
jgi:hypothetical protein